MTNAERLAKDTKNLANIIRRYHCCYTDISCKNCCCSIDGKCLRFSFDLEEWLESEAEEDDEIH